MSAATLLPFDPAASWPEPDARLVNGGVRPAPPLPLTAFGPLASFVADLAMAKGAPSDYVALALLTTAAGVIGDARAVRLRPGWTEPCVLWGAVVGAPSTGKTQPLDVMKRAVRAIEPEDEPDFEEIHRAWETKAAAAKEVEAAWLGEVKKAVRDGIPPPPKPADADAPSAPVRPRIMVGTLTVEKLGLLFDAFPRGLLVLLDEGAAWFGNLNKYGGSGDEPFFLSAFNGIGTIVDRVKEGGSVAPERALLSACVGIQPERLSDLMFARADDGFLSRFLMVWPDPLPPVWEAPLVDEGRVTELLRRLRSLRPGTDAEGKAAPVVLPLSPHAEALFKPWYLETKAAAQAASGLTAGFLGKATGVAGRIALVIELLTWAATGGSEPADVSARSMAAALTLSSDYFAPMAGRIYGDAARSPAERGAAALLKAIRARSARTVNKREVYRDWGVPSLGSADKVQPALDVLEDGDCLRDASATTERGGRKRGDYLVNPRVFGAAS